MRTTFFSSAIISSDYLDIGRLTTPSLVNRKQSRANRTGKLRIRRHLDLSADDLLGHVDQIGIVGHHPAGHDHVFGQGIHLQHAFDYREEEALDDIRDLLAMADVLQHLGAGKNRAITAQLDHVGRLFGVIVHRLQRNIEPQGHLFQKGARAGGALAVHLEFRAQAGIAQFDDFVVLPPDIDDRNGMRKVVKTALAMAGDLGFGGIGKGDIAATVTGGDTGGDRVHADTGHAQGFF
ncbi:hypothetical protein DESC_720174 [Desulfosarcina cetonica]|nr:hypothetical protein DESC_720174 [Desulfosarcina cetonica]